MASIYRYTTDPSIATLNHNMSDDVLQLPDPLGPFEVQRRLDAAPWFPGFVRGEWHTDADVGPYVTAYAATARIVLATAVLGSRSPQDLGHALALPTMFVRLVLVSLEAVNWRSGILRALTELVSAEVVDLDEIKDTLDDSVIDDLPDKVEFLDLLKAVGPEL